MPIERFTGSQTQIFISVKIKIISNYDTVILQVIHYFLLKIKFGVCNK